MRISNEHLSRGLCVNCDDRHVCKLHPNGEQILFCEEYKLSSGEDDETGRNRRIFAAPIDFGIKL